MRAMCYLLHISPLVWPLLASCSQCVEQDYNTMLGQGARGKYQGNVDKVQL